MGKRNDEVTQKIQDIVIQAITFIKEESNGKIHVNIKDNIHFLTIPGGGDKDVKFIKGMALELKNDYPDQVKRIPDAKIACIEPSIEPKKFKFADMKKQDIRLQDLSEQEKLKEEQYNYLKNKKISEKS